MASMTAITTATVGSILATRGWLRQRCQAQQQQQQQQQQPSSYESLAAILVLAAVCAATMAVSDIQPVAGHGTSSETFPPVELNGRQVALEISSSAPPPPETTGRPPTGIMPGENLQIGMALVDFDSKVTLRDVTFQIRAELGNKFLFEREFRADNGFLVFNFASDDSAGDKITVRDGGEGGDQYDIVSYLLGVESRNIRVSGPSLADGGLYKFDISIITAGDYSERLDAPIEYDSGISIPMITTYGIKDPNFGDQYIRVITYYDKIADFEYDSDAREIRYSMPFEWSDSNIDQSYVVHEELSIPDTYGDLLLSGFELYINGVRLPEETVLIDDFFTGERIVHFIVRQDQLYDIRDSSSSSQEADVMNFVVRPDSGHPRIASVTENGQFRIFASWEPEELRSGQDARIIFEVTDVFLKGAPIAAEYHFSVTAEDGSVIFEQSGVSTDSRDDPTNVAEFGMPQGVSGIVYLNFERLQGNERASTSMPVVIDRVSGDAVIDDGTIGITAVGTGGAGETSYNKEEGGGCLIATAAYGSELAPQVQQLRELRDNTVLRTAYGTAFVSGFNSIYYTFSPAVADLQREHQTLRDMTRITLTPMLASLMLLDGASIGTEYDMLAYGISIIALNVAVYVALPAAVTVIAYARLKRRRGDRLPDASMRTIERR